MKKNKFRNLIVLLISVVLLVFPALEAQCRIFKRNIAREKFISYCIFMPDSKIKKTPQDYNLKYEDVYIKLPDSNTLYGWFIPAKTYKEKYIIYLHGTKGNVETYLPGIEKLYDIGANILIVDYRGFGKSTGKELISRTIEDAEAMYDYLIKEKHAKAENIGIFGYSYGGAVAAELALRRPAKGIVIECSFSSLLEIAITKHSPFVRFIISDRILNSKENLKKIKIPVLISYAENDQVIPIGSSKKLFDSANEPKYLYKIKKSEHQNVFKYIKSDYVELIKKVLL